MIVLIMGVSGSGKSTVARRLSQLLDWDFIEADEYHPPDNIARMQAGLPLRDADREPWLYELNRILLARQEVGSSAVLACSALTAAYRRRLLQGVRDPRTVCLHGSEALIRQRMSARTGHFMPPQLLRSQFEGLELPKQALIVEIGAPLTEILHKIQRYILTQR